MSTFHLNLIDLLNERSTFCLDRREGCAVIAAPPVQIRIIAHGTEAQPINGTDSEIDGWNPLDGISSMMSTHRLTYEQRHWPHPVSHLIAT